MTTLFEDILKKVKDKVLGNNTGEAMARKLSSQWDETIVAGLTPAKLAAIMKDSAGGDPIAFLGLAEEMEELDPHYRSVLATRKLAIISLDAVVEPVSEDKSDHDIADFVREIIETPAFADLMMDLLDGLGKGYSSAEIIWDTTGNLWRPVQYIWRDPRLFAWDNNTRSLKLRREEGEPVAIEPFKYVSHIPKLKSGVPVRGALARLIAWSFLYKNYTIKDWMRFLDVYGMPLRVGKYNASTTEDQKRDLLRALANLGSDAAAAIPSGMEIEFIQSSSGSSSSGPVFGHMAEYIDKQISKAVLGQTMTTDDGSSMAQAEVHDDVRDDIKRADASQMEVTINRDIIIPAIALNFGIQEKYPTVTLPVPEPEDLKLWTESVSAFVDRGLKVSLRQIREKLTLDEPDGDDDVLAGKAASPKTPDDTDDDQPPPAPSKKEKAHSKGCPCCGGNTQLALANSEPQDELDRLVAEALEAGADDIDGMIEPILKAARASSSFDEFSQKLAGIAGDMDTGAFITRLGSMTSKARGLGDVRDEP